MSETVREIMNKELFSLRPFDTVESARNGILALGITAAPVLDAQFHPVGIVSLRDLSDEPRTDPVEGRMSAPVVCVAADEPARLAALRLGGLKLRHAVVVDREGRAVGMVSAGDVLRSLLGLGPSHPPAFPQVDLTLEPELVWSEDFPLELDWTLTRAPAGPGILGLATDDPRRPLVWIESCENVRGRLIDILSAPLDLEPALRAWMEQELFHLRFRFVALSDPLVRARVVADMREEIRRI
jgi:CBS domain-containing protein